MHDLPKISKPLYIGAIVLWAVSMVVAVLSLFWNLGDLIALFFPVVLIEMLLSGAFRRDAAAALKKGKRDLFGRIISVFTTIALILFLAAFIAIFPGLPEIVDGAYVRTSHGEVVATLTQKEWRMLTLCERMSQPLVFLVFTSSLLDGIHSKYREQQASTT